MNNIYLQLLLVAAVVVYIVDLSGFTDTLLGWASKFTARFGYGPVKNLRPFTCSLCMVWWCCLLWSIFRNNFTLPVVAYCAALSAYSITLTQSFIFIREAVLKLLRTLMKWIDA